jgi:starch synthase
MSRILMVASEVAPFAKTGGLADVLGALPPALARIGEEVAVVTPRYQVSAIGEVERVADNMHIVVGPHTFPIWIDQLTSQGVQYFFVNCPPLYDRPGIYGEAWGYADNHIRYALLNHAALAVARYLFHTDIFHLHDWQCGLLPVYLRENLRGDPTFFGTKCLHTIHNLGYQGNFPASVLAELGLTAAHFNPGGFEFYGDISFLKAGIVWSDAISTVSPTYAREIQTPEYGFGFDGLLRSRASKLTGILNGIDFDQWNPATDPLLPAHFSAANLSGKLACKKALLEEMGLPVDLERPLIGIVSRFAAQKGFDLLGEIANGILDENVALAVLGSGESRFEDMFRHLAYISPDRFAVRIGYNDRLSHLIEAGSDMFLMPSRYEPCGLNQMYSLRYGTVPIVRSTGGLADTVDKTTGFGFTPYTPEALSGAIKSALESYASPSQWEALVKTGMGKDYSWTASAREYQGLYRMLG